MSRVRLQTVLRRFPPAALVDPTPPRARYAARLGTSCHWRQRSSPIKRASGAPPLGPQLLPVPGLDSSPRTRRGP